MHRYIPRGEIIMYKLVLKKRNNYIKSQDDWLKYAPPKGTNHWRKGQSTELLAEYIVSAKGYLPKEIEDILISIQCKNNDVFYGEPEAITMFNTKGAGRNHDLLLVKKNDIVIGVDAKVDERFGNKVSSILAKSISNNQKERIKQFNKEIYGQSLNLIPNVTYELLSATSGVLIEANKANATKAVLLICTFVNGSNADIKKIIKNIDDIYQFKSTLGKTGTNGQYNVPAYPKIDFYIKHIEV